MSASLAICEVTAELKEQLKQFRFSKNQSICVLILKIERNDQRLVIEQKLQDCEIEDICDELPPQQPRYILISYPLNHSDGRMSYPLCLVFYSPPGSSPEMQMLYAGSRNNLVKECEFTKNLEIRDVEELTREFLESKML